MLVEINDEQRRGWFLSYSVRLWRGRIGTVALPLVDLLQRSSHERCLVVLGQVFGVAERRDALLIGQHADGPRPVGTGRYMRILTLTGTAICSTSDRCTCFYKPAAAPLASSSGPAVTMWSGS